MSILWKKIEFFKGKRDCEAIVIAAGDLGLEPCRDIQGPKFFAFLISLR